MGMGYIDVPDWLRNMAEGEPEAWSDERRGYQAVKRPVVKTPIPSEEERMKAARGVRFNTTERSPKATPWRTKPAQRRDARRRGDARDARDAYRCWMLSDEKRSILVERSHERLSRRVAALVEENLTGEGWVVACECGHARWHRTLREAKKDDHFMSMSLGCRATIAGGVHGAPGAVRGGRRA